MQFDQLKRREFITLLGGAAAAWPLAADAQKAAMPVVGWLSTTSPGPMVSSLVAFRRGLNETGYVEGQNLTIEYRWAEGQFNRQAALVDDLVDRQVAVIVAVFGIGPASAAKAATSTIPIVFVYDGDPVKHGLVASLNRPGGNVTGVTSLAEELAGKRVDMLHLLVPHAKTVGFLSGPSSSMLVVRGAEEFHFGGGTRTRPRGRHCRMSQRPRLRSSVRDHGRTPKRSSSELSHLAISIKLWHLQHGTSFPGCIPSAGLSRPVAW